MRALGWLFGSSWGVRSLDGVSPPDSPENRAAIVRFLFPGYTQFVAVALACIALVMAAGPVPEDTNAPAVFTMAGIATVALTPLIWLTAVRLPLWMLHVLAAGCVVLLGGACFAVGIVYSPFSATLGWVFLSTMTFVVGTRRSGFLHLGWIGANYALVLHIQDGNSAPAGRWVAVMGIVLVSSTTISSLVERTRQLAVAERQARAAEHVALDVAEQARAELAELNATLEARVVDQVDELGKLNGLRRFLSGPVADAVLSGDAGLLEPHRRQIAVFFCDLRGFTGFASGAEPEDVVDVLDDYYRTVGEVLKRYDATVGTFAGDGIMAYLGDPVPCEEPAGKAVAMALDLRPRMAELAEIWRRRGQPLGFGIGISYGYATLGMIGFEGRNDYTALGSVVNLAARLCGEAGDGEILVDQRTVVAVGDDLSAERVDVAIKGFEGAVSAYRVLA